MPQEFKLQDPGEGVREVDILEILVAEGDTVSEGQDLLTVESDKAAIELPSPFDGTISEIRVKEGDTAVVGDVLIVFEDADTDADTPEEEPEADTERTEEEAAEPDEDEREDAPSEDGAEEEEAKREDSDEERGNTGSDPDAETRASSSSGARDEEEGAPVRASPAARKLAAERDVDLADIEPSGADGQVTVEDVKDAAPRDDETKATQSGSEGEPKGDAQTGEDAFGPVVRQRMSSIRAATARMTARSWSRIPHVVHEDAADITELELWRRKQEGDVPSLLPIVAKAASIVLQDHPRFNATLDTESDEIVLRRYCNINIAVATDRGLVTPVVREADAKSVRDLASEMSELAQKARDRKLRKSDMTGGTFTITNIGSVGGRSLSPIINEPQTAILGLGRARVEAVPAGDIGEGPCEVEARMMLPLAVAFDHRVIDGADAARFTNDLMALLRDPVSLAVEV